MQQLKQNGKASLQVHALITCHHTGTNDRLGARILQSCCNLQNEHLLWSSLQDLEHVFTDSWPLSTEGVA